MLSRLWFLPLVAATLTLAACGSAASSVQGRWAAHPATCAAPTDLPGTRVNVGLGDMRMTQMMGEPLRSAHMMLRAAPATVAAGQVSLVAANTGWRPTSWSSCLWPPVSPPAGAVGWVTLTLTPGRYDLICNLANHYADGMHQVLLVTPTSFDDWPRQQDHHCHSQIGPRAALALVASGDLPGPRGQRSRPLTEGKPRGDLPLLTASAAGIDQRTSRGTSPLRGSSAPGGREPARRAAGRGTEAGEPARSLGSCLVPIR